MQQPNAFLNVLVSRGQHVGLTLSRKSAHTGVFLLFLWEHQPQHKYVMGSATLKPPCTRMRKRRDKRKHIKQTSLINRYLGYRLRREKATVKNEKNEKSKAWLCFYIS